MPARSTSTNPNTASDELEDGADFTAGTNPNDTDPDDDLLPDGWEIADSLNLLDDGSTNIDHSPDGDPDSDGLVDALEFGTDPNDDTLSYGVESNNGLRAGPSIACKRRPDFPGLEVCKYGSGHPFTGWPLISRRQGPFSKRSGGGRLK